MRAMLVTLAFLGAIATARVFAAQQTTTDAQPITEDREAEIEAVESKQADESPPAAWTDLLLDGTLAGWVQFGGSASFTVQRNEIVGTSRPGIEDSYLCTEAEFGDFELELECKIEIGLNSGIQVRSQVDRQPPRPQVYGYQVEIDSSSRAWTGSLYDQSRSGWLATTEDNRAAREAFVLGKWNQIRIVATGSRVRTWVNGVPAIDYSGATDRTGFIGLQIHRTDLTESLEVRWRRLRIRERNPDVSSETSNGVDADAAAEEPDPDAETASRVAEESSAN